METFNVFIYLIGAAVVITIWVLPIILFFKVWRMCNDVKRITEILEERELNGSAPSVR